MPFLGDYIGHLLSEVTIARMHADLEAVRVAELYASHPLLRNMPVPHFRLPEMNMDVPVVIKQVEEPRGDQPPRGGPQLTDLRKKFDQVLTQHLTREGVEIKPELKRTLKTTLDARMANLTQPPEISVDVNRVADDFSATSLEFLKDVGPSVGADPARMRKLEVDLKAATRLEFLKLRQPPPRLNVLATTQEVREAGPGEIVTRIKLRVTEEAFEWTSIEGDGQSTDRLVPE